MYKMWGDLGLAYSTCDGKERRREICKESQGKTVLEVMELDLLLGSLDLKVYWRDSRWRNEGSFCFCYKRHGAISMALNAWCCYLVIFKDRRARSWTIPVSIPWSSDERERTNVTWFNTHQPMNAPQKAVSEPRSVSWHKCIHKINISCKLEANKIVIEFCWECFLIEAAPKIKGIREWVEII